MAEPRRPGKPLSARPRLGPMPAPTVMTGSPLAGSPSAGLFSAGSPSAGFFLAGLFLAGLLSAGLLLAGCALGPEHSPQTLDKRDVPYGLMSPRARNPASPPSLASQPVIIYLEGANQRLVPVRRIVPRPATISSVLAQLSQGPTAKESGLGLASPASSVGLIVSRGAGSGVVSVNLPDGFEDLDGNDQTMAAAQIVFSLTTFSDVRGVVFYVAGQRAQVPNANGSLTSGPSTRNDYKALLS